MKRDKQRRVERGTRTHWMSYASAGSVALASAASASGDIVTMQNLPVIIQQSQSNTTNTWATVDLDGDGFNDLMLQLGPEGINAQVIVSTTTIIGLICASEGEYITSRNRDKKWITNHIDFTSEVSLF